MTFKEFSPLETFEYALKRWWLVALLTFVGGSLGWLYHRFQSPLYEARAAMIAQIDFTQTGELTELEQDQAIGAVIALMTSPPVLDQVLQQAQALGLPVESFTYGKNAFLERRRSVLEMQVRDPDPKLAASLANLWADTAYAVLSESYKHALKAQSLRSDINGLVTCLQAPEGASPPGILCEAGTPEEIQSRIQTAQTSLNSETLASNALLPAMLFDLSKRADIPLTPVAYRANLFVLGGALIGFVLGVILASLRFRTA